MSNFKLPDSLQKKLVKDLKSKCKMEVNEMLLKVILGGEVEDFKGEACVAQLSLRNGCYVGRGDIFMKRIAVKLLLTHLIYLKVGMGWHYS